MEKEKNNESMPVELADDNIIEIANKAEKRIEAINRIKSIVLRVTNVNDWIDQGGRPYLQVSGGEKVGGLFGISWRIDDSQLTNEEDGHYSYTYKGYFSMGVRTIEFEGSRSTKDPFFSKAHGEVIPVSEIDRNDVKKSALTNLIGNGITRMLGIRNLTWEDLKAAGIDRNKVGKINYKKSEMSEDVKEQRDKIESMINEMIDNDPDKFTRSVIKVTSFIGKDGKEVKGKDSLSKLSEKAIPVTYGKVQKAYKEWKDGKDITEEFEKKEKAK